MSKLIICIDGLGKDLISKENTPFLYKFGKENIFIKLETLFAFTGLEYSFFSGKNPDKIGIWLEFIYSEKSIFNNFLLRFFSFNKKIRNLIAVMMQYLQGRTWISSLHNIPNDKIRYFDSSVKEGIWKLKFFQDKSFAVYKWPFFVTKNGKEEIKVIFKYENDEERLRRLLKKKDKEIYYTQLMGIDKALHKYGKKSEEARRALRLLDKTIGKYVCKFLKNKNGEVFIWSDHGFADIKNYINLEKILPKRKDYLYFIAGTTASFWFENENVKEEVLKSIKKIKDIKVLDKKTADRYKVPLSRKYGDLIVFLEKGNYFFPNFYQKREEEKFVSMHGYPNDNELNGIFITNSKTKKLKGNNLKIYEVRGVLNE